MITPAAASDDAAPADTDHTDTGTTEPADTDHPTGDAQAAENAENESPG